MEIIKNFIDVVSNDLLLLFFSVLVLVVAGVAIMIVVRVPIEVAKEFIEDVADVMKKIQEIIDSITSKQIVVGFSVFAFVLLAVLLLVMIFDNVAEVVGCLLGTLIHENPKTETIRLIGWAINGTFIAIGLAALIQRADAQMGATKAQADAAQSQADNNKLVEKGHAQELFKTATEHLGHANASVHISAFYEFLHLIKDNDNGEEYRKSILNILYAHIRTTTIDFKNSEYVKEVKKNKEPIKPTEEIQGLLDILFKSQDIDRSGIRLNLQRVYFSGVDLASGHLSGADLSKADLSGADLSKADLSGAKLLEADLSGAKLLEANLSKADLSGADLSGANLPRADLSGANLSGAKLPEARLPGANLSKADLSGAKLPKARLPGADLSGADLSGANLPEAILYKTDLSGADLSRARLVKADLSEANLSEANLYKADLSGVIWYEANLSEAKLYNTDLSEAKLLGVNLSGAKLYETDLSGAILSEANLSGANSYKTNLSSADLSSADLSSANLSDADLSKARLGGASYTNETRFPEWFVPLIVSLDNGGKVQFPKGFVAPEKPEDNE